MRIFSVIIILFYYNSILSQTTDREAFDQLERSGRWGDYYIIEPNNQFQLIKKDIKVDSVHFIGDKTISQLVLSKLFNKLLNSPSRDIALSRFQAIQDAHVFLSNNTSMSFAQYNKENIAALIDIRTDFKSHIGGILGSSKDRNGDWKLNGELDFNLENIFKNSSSFRLFWQQPTPFFRLLSFEVNSPLIMGLPFGTNINFDQEFSDENYLLETLSAYFTAIGPYGRWKIGSKYEKTNDFQFSQHTKSRLVAFAVDGDRRNARWLPYSGSYWGTSIDIGKYTDNVGSAIELNSQAHFGIYKAISSSIFSFKIQGFLNHIDNRELISAKQVKFGGSNTLRGYNENQFSADWITLQTFEWISGNLDQSQFFVFIDNAIVDKLDIKPSSGFGLRVFNGTFYYDISVGFPIGGLKDGKIHLKFNTRL